MADLLTYPFYKSALLSQNSILDGGVTLPDFGQDDIKLMLLDNTHSPSLEHLFVDDVSADEVSGKNYLAGGVSITSGAVEFTPGGSYYTGDNVVFSQSATGFNNAKHAVLYNDTGTPSDSLLIAIMTFDSDKGNVSGDLTLSWNEGAILGVIDLGDY